MDSRLLCPWDSPRKNTIVVSHSFPGMEPWSPALQADALPAEKRGVVRIFSVHLTQARVL